MTGIGSSDIASVLGIKEAFLTPLQVWGDKRGIDYEKGERKRDAEYMAWGNRLERAMISALADDPRMAACSVLPSSGLMLRHAEDDWLIDHPDGVVVDANGDLLTLELKNVNSYKKRDWEDEPPLHYQVQSQHHMLVSGCRRGVIAALFGGNEFSWWYVDASPKLHDLIRAEAAAFWRRVTEDDPPPAVADDNEVISRIIQQKDQQVVTLDSLPPPDIESVSSWEELDDRLVMIKEEIKTLEDEKKKLEVKIKEAIGEHSHGLLSSGACYSYLTQARDEYIVKAATMRVLRRKKGK
jgi:predicted phage-related endonuclease